MAGAFQILRSNDLIWSRLVHDYLMGERAPMTDLMAWNATRRACPTGCTPSTCASCSSTTTSPRAATWSDGQPVALADIRLPMFVVGTETGPRRAVAVGLQDPPLRAGRGHVRADVRRAQRGHRVGARPRRAHLPRRLERQPPLRRSGHVVPPRPPFSRARGGNSGPTGSARMGPPRDWPLRRGPARRRTARWTTRPETYVLVE